MSETLTNQYTEPLTEREQDVLGLLVSGNANKEIALKLNIGEKTVKTHVSSILSKLGVSSRTQAVLYALRTGLVTQPSSRSGNKIGGRLVKI